MFVVFCVSSGGCCALCTAVLRLSFYTFCKRMQFRFASHAVSFYIGVPSHTILYMLPINSILDTFSKKRNFYTLVVSAVMCVVTFLSVMLCCIVL